MIHPCLKALLLLLLLSLAFPASGWSRTGHRLIGELAERELSPQVIAQVRWLLRDEPDPSLAGIATWADEVRDDADYAWSAPFHYVQIRNSNCRFDRERDCADDRCVVDAIQRYAQRMVDPTLSELQRAEALKFVVHFVGDVHQPLHAGRRDDKGGNDFQISLRQPQRDPEGTNLHSIWDYHILAGRGLEYQAYADVLQSAQRAPRHWTPADAVEWAETSCALTDTDGFYPERAGRLPADYLVRMRPLAERRVVEAGTRLAALLETVLRDAAPH